MYGYSYFSFTDPYLRPHLRYPSLAVRLVMACQYPLIALIILPVLVSTFKHLRATRAELVCELMWGVSLVWPLVVLTAWQIQRNFYIPLRAL